MGGLHCILFGDNSQLWPIADYSLYTLIQDPSREFEGFDLIGAETYAAFDKAVIFEV